MAETIPFSGEELLRTGLVDPSKRQELEQYIEARRAFDDLFGREPGVGRLVGKITDARHRLNDARAHLRDHAAEARAVLAALEGRALEPLAVILRAEPDALEEVKRTFAQARDAVEGDPESEALPAALGELARLLGRVHAERTGANV